MSKKYCYLFTEGNAKMRELLGGKGANLAEMTNIGLPVPQGFTITTEACTQYYEDGRQINDAIMAEIMEYIEKMEQITGKKFGDHENPLLVSVRSGARASMPGMMDTILNLGLNEDVVDVIAKKSNNPRWAWDCYRRFIQMYSDVVMEVGKKYFEQLIDEMKVTRNVKLDTELTAEDLKELAEKFNAAFDEFKSCNGVVVLSDLPGGSPFKTAVECKYARPEQKIEVIAGTNLPMIVTAVTMLDMEDDPRSLADELIETGRDCIALFELEAATAETESEESDGI